VAIAVRAKPGDFANCRMEYLKSLNIMLCTRPDSCRFP
jgi:hypothetical protein